MRELLVAAFSIHVRYITDFAELKALEKWCDPDEPDFIIPHDDVLFIAAGPDELVVKYCSGVSGVL